MSARGLLALLALVPAGCVSAEAHEDAASAWNEEIVFPDQCEDWDDWDKPADPFRVFGNTYYVGTCGIAALLVTGSEGHVLIDTGTAAGARAIMDNIAAVGVDMADVKVLLHSHEHFDHVGGMAAIQRASGAAVFPSPQALEVIRTGQENPSDPQAGMHEAMEQVANVQEGLVPFPAEDAHPIYLGDLEMKAWATPGHTPGALTWQWESCEDAVCRTIVYADSLSPVSADDYRFSEHPEYLAAYREGLRNLAALDCDILLTPHPSASGMRDKLLADDIASGMNCREYAASVEARLDERLAKEKAQ